jgi:DamX protein
MSSLLFASAEFYMAHGLQEDPFQSGYDKEKYFVTAVLQQRLELLRHLLEFSQQLILIKGPEKVGKTCFVRHLLNKADEKRVFYRINAVADVSPDTLVSVILREQAVESGENTGIMAALNACLHSCSLQGKTPVLVVDDADKLNKTTLRFIIQLMEFSQQDTFFKVILIGSDSLLQSLNEIAGEISNTGLLHSVNIPAFDLQQTQSYLQHRLHICGASGDLFSSKEISRIHKVSGGLAGNINFLARQGLSDPAQVMSAVPDTCMEYELMGGRGSRRFAKIYIAGLCLLAVLVAAALYSFKFPTVETQSVSLELLAKPVTSSTSLTNSHEQKNTQSTDSMRDPAGPKDLAEESGDKIPAPSGARQKGGALDKKPGRHTDPAMTRQTLKLAGLNMERTEQQNSRTVINGTDFPKDEIRGHQWLMEQASDSYVLQLIGAIKMATITDYVNEARLDRKQLALYKTRQAGEDWYVLVYGNFPSREKALAELESLLTRIKGEKPWPKTMKSIQKVIDSTH